MRYFMGMFFALALVGEAKAAESFHYIADISRNIGATITFKRSGQVGNLEEVFDRDTVIRKIPDMQKAGLLNSDITQTAINMAPNSAVGTVTLIWTPVVLPSAFESYPINKLHTNVYSLTRDAYGNAEKHLIYSFDFTRSLYQRINWNHFDANGLMKVAPGFRFSPWYEGQTAIETE